LRTSAGKEKEISMNNGTKLLEPVIQPRIIMRIHPLLGRLVPAYVRAPFFALNPLVPAYFF
jgi:hypothetical protein